MPDCAVRSDDVGQVAGPRATPRQVGIGTVGKPPAARGLDLVDDGDRVAGVEPCVRVVLVVSDDEGAGLAHIRVARPSVGLVRSVELGYLALVVDQSAVLATEDDDLAFRCSLSVDAGALIAAWRRPLLDASRTSDAAAAEFRPW